LYVKEGLLLEEEDEIARVVNVTPLKDYRILVEFRTGEKVIFDMTPYIDEPYFRGLRNKEVFDAVHCQYFAPHWQNEELGLDAIFGLATIFENGISVQ